MQKEAWVLRDERPERRVCQSVCVCRGEKQAGWGSAQEAGDVVAAASSACGLGVGI